MPTRRLATDIEPIGVTVETSGILIDPSDGAADLVGENHQVAADILNPSEVGNDVMRVGGQEHLGWTGEILRAPAAPSPAMDEYEDRRQFASGAVYVQSLDLGRAIGDALGLADTMARQFAVADSAADQLLTVRGVGGLIIRGIECGLVIAEEYWLIFSGIEISLLFHSL